MTTKQIKPEVSPGDGMMWTFGTPPVGATFASMYGDGTLYKARKSDKFGEGRWYLAPVPQEKRLPFPRVSPDAGTFWTWGEPPMGSRYRCAHGFATFTVTSKDEFPEGYTKRWYLAPLDGVGLFDAQNRPTADPAFAFEFRLPNKGETYWSRSNNKWCVKQFDNQFNQPRWVRLPVTPSVPSTVSQEVHDGVVKELEVAKKEIVNLRQQLDALRKSNTIIARRAIRRLATLNTLKNTLERWDNWEEDNDNAK